MVKSVVYFVLGILLIFLFINITSIIIITIISFYLSINIFIINNLILLILLKAMILLLFFILKNRKVRTRKIIFKFFISDIKIIYPSLVFTVLFFSFIFWNRIILEQLPRNLNHYFDIGFQTYFIGFLMIYFFLASCI